MCKVWILEFGDFGFWGFWILDFGDLGFWILDWGFWMGTLWQNFGCYIRKEDCARRTGSADYQIHVLQMANTHPFPSCVGPSVVKCLFFWTGRHDTVCHEIRNQQTSRNSAGLPSEFPKAIHTRVSMQIASGRRKQLHDNIVQLIWALPAKLMTK